MAFQLENIQAKEHQKSQRSFDIDSVLKKEITLFGSAFNNKKKEAFYVELNVLLQAGLTLKDALQLMMHEQKKANDKKLFQDLQDEIVSGKNFSEAIKKQKVFTDYEFHSIEIGERTGTLDSVFSELGAFYLRKNQQRRTIVGALSYPIIVMITAFAAIAFMLKFVVPMFENIFKQNNTELPALTKAIIAASAAFERYFLLGFLFLIGLLVFFRISRKKVWYKKMVSAFWLRIPFVGEFIRKVRIAQFTQAINLLTSAKVPLLNGIQLTKKMIDYYPLQVGLEKVEKDILLGKSFHESIEDIPIFDKKMSSLIKVAEETNQNETIFKRITEQYNQEIEYKSKMISSTIEPIIVLVLGAIVAIVLIAMYLPMFKLSTVIS
ncbi:type II secretion system F family protein [Pseudotenacibaculum sp. MALMAid0570]|uniref:type II secretion system F family protein n=1 Tax=Pseudotenacibaculum sp. MALMAid0570 TaxID=3143938 RepID=UPI0032DF21F3